MESGVLSIASRTERAIKERVFPGCVVGIVRKSGEREILPFGHFMYENSPAVENDSIYDVASVTKSIPTASLALNFLGKGGFNLSDPVKKYMPELRNDYGATIEDLLMYRVSGTQLSVLKDKTPDEITRYVFENGFEGLPGESWYTNLPAYLLGVVLERYFGDLLPNLAESHFFMPLGMTRTSFLPISKNGIAPTEVVDGQEVCGIVHDESARVFAKAGKAVGHAGLFSTAPDILNFLEALLQETYPHVVEGARRGLGWELNQPFMGRHAGPHTFGKTGFTGASCVCDAERGIALVILSNRTYPARPNDRSAIDAFRADITDLVLG